MAKESNIVVSHLVTDDDVANLKHFVETVGNWVSNPRVDRRIRIDGTISGRVNIFAKEGSTVIFDVCTFEFTHELIRLGKTIKERYRLQYGK